MNYVFFYPKSGVSTIHTNEMCACDIIHSMIFVTEVQLYSNINWAINFHIDMTKPDKTKVIQEKLLTDEIKKQLNFSISSSASNNESTTKMQELEKIVHTDIDCHLICDVVMSLLDLQQTNFNEPNISIENNTNVPNNFINNTNLPGFQCGECTSRQ